MAEGLALLWNTGLEILNFIISCLVSTQVQISETQKHTSLTADKIHLFVTPLQYFAKTISLIKAIEKQTYLPGEAKIQFFATNSNHLKGKYVAQTTHLDPFYGKYREMSYSRGQSHHSSLDAIITLKSSLIFFIDKEE